MDKIISISKDFSRYPTGRDDGDGPFNGQKFRVNYLVPALKNSDHVIVYLDGPRGYGSSFLDEAFAGLVTKEGFKKEDLALKLKIKFDKPLYQMYEREIWDYINEARR